MKKTVANEFKPVDSVDSVAEYADEMNKPVSPGKLAKIWEARYGMI